MLDYLDGSGSRSRPDPGHGTDLNGRMFVRLVGASACRRVLCSVSHADAMMFKLFGMFDGV